MMRNERTESDWSARLSEYRKAIRRVREAHPEFTEEEIRLAEMRLIEIYNL